MALVGAGRALQTVASVLLMSDPHDLGMVAQVRSPHAERPVVYLYETVPGGVGLAPRLFDGPRSCWRGAEAWSKAATARTAARHASGRTARPVAPGRTLALRLLRQVVAAGVRLRRGTPEHA